MLFYLIGVGNARLDLKECRLICRRQRYSSVTENLLSDTICTYSPNGGKTSVIFVNVDFKIVVILFAPE